MCRYAPRIFFWEAMKVISAIESNYILRWLCYQEQKPIRLRLKVSTTYLTELRQEIKTQYSVANVAVYVMVEQLTPPEKKRMWANVRSARRRQRERDKRKPTLIEVSQQTAKKLGEIRQLIDHLGEGISLDETLAYLIDTKQDHKKLWQHKINVVRIIL